MKDQRKYLREEELKRFLNGTESTRDRAISPFPTAAAWRAAESGQLKFSDWDRKAQRQSRRAELSEAVYEATKGSRRGGVRGQGGAGTLSKLNEARKRQENA